MTAMGLVHSWWAILALPADAADRLRVERGLHGARRPTCKSWQDFDKITLVQLPLFLFSATFFPITAFPDAGALGRRVHAALPRRGALPRAHHRRAVVGLGGVGRLPGRDGAAGLLVVRRRLDALLLT